MSMDYKDKPHLKSTFHFALQGIKHAFMNERNMRIHAMFTIVVIVFGFIMRLSLSEWLFILFAIGGVLSLELINTAIERIVDLATSEYHPLAKQAKDVSAGAVFLFSCLSVIVGTIIFLPKILQRLGLL